MDDQVPDRPLMVRVAAVADATACAALLDVLGYPQNERDVEDRLKRAARSDEGAVFVAQAGEEIVGVISVQCVPLFHTNAPLGRITSLVVAPGFRRCGAGRLLVAEAERFARIKGCTRMEVTSGDHRADAHAFYEGAGYRSDCRRFIKTVPP